MFLDGLIALIGTPLHPLFETGFVHPRCSRIVCTNGSNRILCPKIRACVQKFGRPFETIQYWLPLKRHHFPSGFFLGARFPFHGELAKNCVVPPMAGSTTPLKIDMKPQNVLLEKENRQTFANPHSFLSFSRSFFGVWTAYQIWAIFGSRLFWRR